MIAPNQAIHNKRKAEGQLSIPPVPSELRDKAAIYQHHQWLPIQAAVDDIYVYEDPITKEEVLRDALVRWPVYLEPAPVGEGPLTNIMNTEVTILGMADDREVVTLSIRVKKNGVWGKAMTERRSIDYCFSRYPELLVKYYLKKSNGLGFLKPFNQEDILNRMANPFDVEKLVAEAKKVKPKIAAADVLPPGCAELERMSDEWRQLFIGKPKEEEEMVEQGQDEQAEMAWQDDLGQGEQAEIAGQDDLGQGEQAEMAGQNDLGQGEQAEMAGQDDLGQGEEAEMAGQDDLEQGEQARQPGHDEQADPNSSAAAPVLQNSPGHDVAPY